MKLVIIGRSEGCKWCDVAKEIADEFGRPYVFYEAEGEMKTFLLDLGLTTVPQVWEGTQHIGGYQALVEYLVAEQLAGAA